MHLDEHTFSIIYHSMKVDCSRIRLQLIAWWDYMQNQIVVRNTPECSSACQHCQLPSIICPLSRELKFPMNTQQYQASSRATARPNNSGYSQQPRYIRALHILRAKEMAHSCNAMLRMGASTNLAASAACPQTGVHRIEPSYP